MDIKYFKKKKLPDRPGIYFFKKGKPARAGGDILYIGKATSLKDRVKSYFSKDPKGKQASYGAGLIENRGPLIVKMVQDAAKIEWTVTDSVLEALILEVALIKKYQPKYNTKEKSDKSFNYVCITKEKKIAIVRGKILNKEKFNSFFGPFPNGNQLREALKIIRKIFPYFEDKKGIKGKDEFYKQIKLVPENLIENINNIKNIKLLFEGKKGRILSNLKKEMKVCANNKEFEKAGKTKRQIFALQHINDVALLKGDDFIDNKIFDPAPFFGCIKGNKVGHSDTKILLSTSLLRIEAYDIAHMSGKNMVGVMVVVEDGEIEKKEYRKFKIKTQTKANDIGALKEVLERRLAHIEWPFPGLIVVDGGISQINITKTILTKMGLKIEVVSVLKDKRHKAKAILGDKKNGLKYKREILLANSEAHRFAINYHKNMRNKNFLI